MTQQNWWMPQAIVAAALAVWLLPADQGHAQTLYDGSLGTLPETQGWTFGAFGTVQAIATNGVALLDTSLAHSTQAGWSQVLGPGLDRAKGFALLFSAQLDAETHKNTNRAGFSVILLADDKQGIELGFWTDTIFAQSDAPLFTHGEDASFSTTNGVTAYALAVLGANYILRANGVPILSGPVRDYTEFGGLVSELYGALRQLNRQWRCTFYEGLVAKRADSLYPVQLRSATLEFPGWVKHRWAR